MAPTNSRGPHRGRPSNGHVYRNANTNAGVNHHQAGAPRNASRVRGYHRRRARNDRVQASNNALVGPSLASRITHGNDGGGTARPRPQHVGRPQDRLNADNGNSVRAVPNQQANHGVQGYNDTTAHDNNDFATSNPQAHPDPDYSQASKLFCDSQPTQTADAPTPLSPYGLAFTSNGISMIHQQPNKGTSTASKRPINNYRGKDPIKRLVQNKKLQAILADKPVPRERRKPKDDRMALRMGMNTVLK